MTNNKRIILLTGTTCAGKSTILETIKLVDEPSVKIIPQVTTRQPRTDDDTSLFVYKSKLYLNNYFCITPSLLMEFPNNQYLNLLSPTTQLL